MALDFRAIALARTVMLRAIHKVRLRRSDETVQIPITFWSTDLQRSRIGL